MNLAYMNKLLKTADDKKMFKFDDYGERVHIKLLCRYAITDLTELTKRGLTIQEVFSIAFTEEAKRDATPK